MWYGYRKGWPSSYGQNTSCAKKYALRRPRSHTGFSGLKKCHSLFRRMAFTFRKDDETLILYAKSADCQTLQEHTEKCLEKYKELKTLYPALFSASDWKILYWAVKFHDIGKVDAHFQNKILKAIGKPTVPAEGSEFPHNYLSPAFLNTDYFFDELGFNNLETELLVKVIFYHHARESVIGNYKNELTAYIADVLQKRWNEVQAEGGIPLYDGLSADLQTEYIVAIDYHGDEIWLNDELQERYMKLKGTMNRIDYCASAGVNIEQSPKDDDGYLYSEKTEQFMQRSGFTLRPVQEYLKEHSDQNVIVQASTGCGKTEGALLWLDGKKGFYTLPLKASINAIYQRITENIGYHKAAVLHGDARAVYLEQMENEEANDEQALQKYRLARLLTAPLTVCTIDQLFRFVYKANGTEAPAAALACGNLVIDEIQTYSPELIASILYALHFISDMGGHFCIMTATFPKILFRLMKQHGIPCPEKDALPNFHGSMPCRHRIKLLYEREFPLAQICEQAKTKRVLVLVNRVKRAQQVQAQLKELGTEANVLHSRYLRKDRRTLEKEIQNFAPNNPNREAQCGVWISTQVVEASLDIDFDILYTELCTVDSLLQRMGRVYRSRKYDLGKVPNVYILENQDIGSPKHPIVDGQLYQYTLEAVQKYDGCLLQENDRQDDKTDMMDLVYDEDKNPRILQSNYGKAIQFNYNLLESGEMYKVDNQEIRFRDIDSVTVMPYRVYEQLEGSGELAQIRQKMKHGSYKGKMEAQEFFMDHTIAVPDMGLDIDRNLSANEKRFYPHSGVCLYNGEYDFDETTGQGIGLINQYKNKKGREEFDNFL
ncbi:hypothetical protein B6259_07240 [Ruminococcaceae bacterium CPB6]|uniref:CRISPR-associated helicase/endonuclease Cas3 n=2 Tax=Caproicibacterium lactatifermentans TaxID=2666138 RepID=A0A859DPU3_9FIRM|nr:hypothetical protein B6259_07240 [Ruminococcaceae bacterium CPB6]QKN23584.1 CRISPR-associated helicase/endonuclease Cas3 [Caproicibacterium lactatifermentans]